MNIEKKYIEEFKNHIIDKYNVYSVNSFYELEKKNSPNNVRYNRTPIDINQCSSEEVKDIVKSSGQEKVFQVVQTILNTWSIKDKEEFFYEIFMIPASKSKLFYMCLDGIEHNFYRFSEEEKKEMFIYSPVVQKHRNYNQELNKLLVTLNEDEVYPYLKEFFKNKKFIKRSDYAIQSLLAELIYVSFPEEEQLEYFSKLSPKIEVGKSLLSPVDNILAIELNKNKLLNELMNQENFNLSLLTMETGNNDSIYLATRTWLRPFAKLLDVEDIYVQQREKKEKNYLLLFKTSNKNKNMFVNIITKIIKGGLRNHSEEALYKIIENEKLVQNIGEINISTNHKGKIKI